MQALSKLMGNANLGPKQDLKIQPAQTAAQVAPSQEELTSWELVSSETGENVTALSEGSDTEMSLHGPAATTPEMTEKKQSEDAKMANTRAYIGVGHETYSIDKASLKRVTEQFAQQLAGLADKGQRRESEQKKKAVSELFTMCLAIAGSIPKNELPSDFARPFVCPLGALDPHTCRPTVRLRNLAQVVEHLGRKHAPPQHYCCVCWETFDTAQARDAHARLRSCRVQARPVAFGPTPEELEKMKHIAALDGAKPTGSNNMRSLRSCLLAGKMNSFAPRPCPPAAGAAGTGDAETANYFTIYSAFRPGTLPPASIVVDDETIRMALAAHKIFPRHDNVRKCVAPHHIEAAAAANSNGFPFPHPDALADKFLEEEKWPRDKEKFEAEAKIVKAGRKIPYNNEWIMR